MSFDKWDGTGAAHRHPSGRRKKSRRVGSPLDDMDGMAHELCEAQATPIQQPTLEERPKSPPPLPGMNAETSGTSTGKSELTMDAMERLFDRKLNPVRHEIASLKAHAISRNELTETFKPLKIKVDDLVSRIETLESARSQISDHDSRASSQQLGSAIEAKLQQMENQLAELHAEKPRDKNALIGGLDKFENIESAATWIKAKISEMRCEAPADVFSKGAFGGLVFVKFKTVDARNDAVIAIQRARLKHSGVPVWAKHDLPMEQRVPEAFLFGLKKVMLEWNYTKEELYVKKEDQTLEVAKETVVAASVVNGSFVVNWTKEWGVWAEFSLSPEVTALSSKATETLRRAAAAAAKGSGKGKKGKKGPRAE